MKIEYFGPLIERETKRVSKHVERAKKQGVAATLTIEQWLHTCALFDWKCFMCKGVEIGMEHLRPIWLGGGTTAGNVVPCCTVCNNDNNRVMRRIWTAYQVLNEVGGNETK